MKVAAYARLLVVVVWASFAASRVTEGPWLLNREPVPKQALRITTLGSGTPDVRKDQVSSGFLLELGNGDKFIWDLGTGSYQNLLATAVPAAELTKVGQPFLTVLLLILLSGQRFAIVSLSNCRSSCMHYCMQTPPRLYPLCMTTNDYLTSTLVTTLFLASLASRYAVCFSLVFCTPEQVFLTHLHSDHIADLATFYAGAMFGRTEPWEVWGPSSEQPELGLNASIAGLRQVQSAAPHSCSLKLNDWSALMHPLLA